MGLFAIMLGRETDVDPEMVARLSDPGSWEATDRRRDYAMAGGGQQPAYRPAQGYPHVQYAQQQYQPQVYSQANFVQEQSRPAVVRVAKSPANNMFVANAAIESTANGLVMFPAILDTGAGNSFITHDVARRCGLDLGRLVYANTARTPTGEDSFAGFTVPDLCLLEDPNMRQGGYVIVDDVRIGVFRRDTLATSILGMSFLEKLTVNMSGGTMVLSQ